MALWQSAKGEVAVNRRLLLVLAACTISFFALGVWWLCKQHKQIRLLRVSLMVPHKVLDDYEHLADRGFWVHRKTGQRVCGSCIVSSENIGGGIVSPLALTKYRHVVTKALTGAKWECGRNGCDKKYPAKPDEYDHDA